MLLVDVVDLIGVVGIVVVLFEDMMGEIGCVWLRKFF